MLTQPSVRPGIICDDRKPHPGHRLTAPEFEAWTDEDTRAEWVDGEVILLDAATPDHEDLGILLVVLLQMLARRQDLGRALGTQVLVELPGISRRRLPDVVFVAKNRLDIITDKRVIGAPDLIMEIISPDSVTRDLVDKRTDYEAAGVKEYWCISGADRRVVALGLGEDARYQFLAIEPTGIIRSQVIPTFWLNPDWLWQNPLPDPVDILRELGVTP